MFSKQCKNPQVQNNSRSTLFRILTPSKRVETDFWANFVSLKHLYDLILHYGKYWTASIGWRVCQLCFHILTALFSYFDGHQYAKHANFSWADIGTSAAALYTWLIWSLFILSIVVLVFCSFLNSKVHRQFACFFPQSASYFSNKKLWTA